MKQNYIFIGIILVLVIGLAGCTSASKDRTGYGLSAPQDGNEQGSTAPLGALMFTNQNINTQAEAEAFFATYKQEIWDTYEQELKVRINYTNLGMPVFDAMKVYPFDPNSQEASQGFMGNIGTIKFVMELPTVLQSSDWKIENEAVFIRGCKSSAVLIDNNQAPVCSSEDTIWAPAPITKFWVNDKGVVFARGISFISFEDIYWKEESLKVTQFYSLVGQEKTITFVFTPNLDAADYKFDLATPPEVEVVSGSKTQAVDLKKGETKELSWTIKATKAGNYQLSLKYGQYTATQELRVEQTTIGVGIPTE